MTDKTTSAVAPTAEFVNRETAMQYWAGRLASNTNVPMPDTEPIPLDTDVEGMPEWETQMIADTIEALGGAVHIRGELTSGNGPYRLVPDADAIDRIVATVLTDHVEERLPHGDTLYVREWLDLDWLDDTTRHTGHPEVRFFIRDGTIACHHIRMDCMERPGPDVTQPEPVQDARTAVADDLDKLKRYAGAVATEFSEPDDPWFSVDFVQDVNGDWYCIDMAQDALYDSTERGDDMTGTWQNCSAHPAHDCPHDLEGDGWTPETNN